VTRRRWSQSDSGECGTYPGYSAHMRERTPVCQPCRDAATAYQAYRRFRFGEQQHPTICRGCGSIFRGHICGGKLARPYGDDD
jgi:hypothetical protein